MSEEFTDDEIKRLRALLVADTRRQWLVSGLAGVAKYIAIIAGGWFAFKGLLVELIPWEK